MWPGFLNYLKRNCDGVASPITNGSMAVLIFFHERYKSLDRDVKGKVNEHFIRRQAHYVFTLDIPLKLLCKTIERKTKRKCVLKAGRHKFESTLSEGIIHGTLCWR
jgi:hypothetical protein